MAVEEEVVPVASAGAICPHCHAAVLLYENYGAGVIENQCLHFVVAERIDGHGYIRFRKVGK